MAPTSPLVVDGIMGPLTRAAAEYMFGSGLNQSATTMKELFGNGNAANPACKVLQGAINARQTWKHVWAEFVNGDPLPIDGQWGANTEGKLGAIFLWYAHNGLASQYPNQLFPNTTKMIANGIQLLGRDVRHFQGWMNVCIFDNIKYGGSQRMPYQINNINWNWDPNIGDWEAWKNPWNWHG